MLTADVLNSTATINDFDVINNVGFIAGEALTLVIRVKQPQRSDLLRYVPPSTCIGTAKFNLNDGTTLTKTMTAFVDDRSIWSISLTNADTDSLVSGNFTFSLDLLGDATQVVPGLVSNALSLVITGFC